MHTNICFVKIQIYFSLDFTLFGELCILLFIYHELQWNKRLHLSVEAELILSPIDSFIYNLSCIYIIFFFWFLQYSVFGSIINLGGVIGGLQNGGIADLIGRRGVSFFSHIYIS